MSEWKDSENRAYTQPEYNELDPLTGLSFSNVFMKKAEEMMKALQPNEYCMVALDIEHLKLFNKIFGRDAGENLIIYIAGCVRKAQEDYGSIAGYFGSDDFCVILPDQMDIIEKLRDNIIKGVKQWNDSAGFLPSLGVYSINDVTVSPEVMYDRAEIALSCVPGKYPNRICRYDSSMERDLVEEWKLLSEIQAGLENGEFTFFAQPQCNIVTGKIVGAESLVRWKHGTKGMISPGVFIPLLEKNGLIPDLDRYVWEKVCEWLRSWIDRGYRPVPISVNISRIDISSMDVPKYLMGLLKKYNLPAKYIKTEITESAYAEDDTLMKDTVRRLQEAGFMVLMDDFGSGYSSLNMLKSVSVDVLKMDMRFLDMDVQEEHKGIGILESVVNMAKLMGLPIIVEGVETLRQEKILHHMGCRYTQGYYYYKPLPIEKFEALLVDERMLDFDGLYCKQVESLHVREFLDNNVFSDAMVNNIIGPAAFYDMYKNRIEITRVNEPYYQMSGVSSNEEETYSKKFWNQIRDDDRPLLLSIFEQAYENSPDSAQGNIHFLRMDGQELWVYIKVFFLRETDEHKIFYSSFVDMTDMQKEDKGLQDQKVSQLLIRDSDKMAEYYGDIPCGYGIARILADDFGEPLDYEIVYINERMQRICGGDVKRLRSLIGKTFENDSKEFKDIMYRAAFQGETVKHYTYSPVSNTYCYLIVYQYEYGYAACILQDVTNMHIYEDTLKSMVLAYREVYFLNLKDNYCRMVYPDEDYILERGNFEEVMDRHFTTGKISKYDLENVRRFLSLENIRSTLLKQDSMEYRYKRKEGLNGGTEWCLTSITVSHRENGVPETAVMTIRNIDNIMKEEESLKHRRMAESLANMNEGFLIYRALEDERILYANPGVMEIFGCETMEEFQEFVNYSFRGMVHPEDLERVEWEIHDQIRHSDQNMDYTQYRIIRKDGQVRWIDDFGHLEDSAWGVDNRLFYVFIIDVTDTISEKEKRRLLSLNPYYQK